VDFHERPVSQSGERRDRCNLPRAVVEDRPTPHVAQRIAGDGIGQDRKLAAKTFESRLRLSCVQRPQQLLASLVSIGSGGLCKGDTALASIRKQTAAAIAAIVLRDVMGLSLSTMRGVLVRGFRPRQLGLAVGRTMISLTSTSSGCSIANAMARAMASGVMAI
jgi:hypothetical protein